MKGFDVQTGRGNSKSEAKRQAAMKMCQHLIKNGFMAPLEIRASNGIDSPADKVSI